jgi:hypothetical protein
MRINKRSQIADGLCMGGFVNLSGIPVNQTPETPIHVRGEVEIDEWYEVTISEVRSSHLIAKADHLVDGRTGNKVEGSGDHDTGSRDVWWVNTTRAECFHASKSCDMLKNREGELCRAEIDDRNEPLPAKISDMRRCRYCF